MILALQFYEKCAAPAMELATLLADLESGFRGDVLLALVHQPTDPPSDLVVNTVDYCSRRFQTACVGTGTGVAGWPQGAGDLWVGTMRHFGEEYRRGLTFHQAIFIFDGNDCVPLHRNWLDLLIEEHAKTVTMGKQVTGAVIDGGHHLAHINANMVMELPFWNVHPELFRMPPSPTGKRSHRRQLGHDRYHGRTILPHASASTVICSEWNQTGITREILDGKAAHSIWLHGYKDAGLHTMARQRLSSLPADAPGPIIQRTTLPA